MLHSSSTERRSQRLLPLFFLCLSVAGCGLGMDDAERLERARSAFETGDYRVAVIDTRNILQHAPDNRDARLLLGRAALRLNDPATAEKELRNAVRLGTALDAVAVDLGLAMLARGEHAELLEEIQPELAATEADRNTIRRLRGDALLALHRPAEARASYKAVLAADSGDLSALAGIASTHVAEGDYAEARAVLDRTLALDASYLPARLISGSLYLSVQQPEKAAPEFARATELARAAGRKTDEAAALSGRIEAELALEDVAGAKGTLADLEAIAPEALPTSYLRARLAFVEENYDAAHAELQKVLAATPESGPAQFLMGAVQLRRGNLGQAEMHLSALVGDARFDADARKLLAQVRLRQDRADEAADLLRPLLAADGSDLGALNLAVRASLAAGEAGDAVDYLERAHANDPDDSSVRLDLAGAYLATGDVDAAEALLADGSGGDSDAETYRRAFLRVLAPLRRGDATSALEQAQAMTLRWPADARVQNLIGGIALEQDDRDLARRSFAAARDLDPDGLMAYLNLAKLDEDGGDFDAARKQYQAALERHPESARLMLARGQLEARAGNEAEAVEWLERARTADAAALAPRIVLARYYVAKGEYAAAGTAASEALAIAGTNSEAHNLLGLARQGQGNVDEARSTLLAGGELDLGDLPSAVLAAGLEARQGNTAAAMEIAKELEARYPAHPVPYALEAELLAKDGGYQEAAAVYDKALSLAANDRRLALGAYRVRNAGGLASPERPLSDYLKRQPDDADVRVVLAQLYQQRGESERAIAEYERALAAAPDHFVALNNLAWEYFVTGDARAEQTAAQAFERAPDNASVADTLGWIRVKQGEVETGIATLRKAVELAGDNPEIRYHLAAGLAAAGEVEEARSVLDEALAGDDFAGRADALRLRDSL